MKRKPVALAVTGERHMVNCIVIADDGSIWERDCYTNEWGRVPDIPQPEEETEK